MQIKILNFKFEILSYEISSELQIEVLKYFFRREKKLYISSYRIFFLEMLLQNLYSIFCEICGLWTHG